MNGWMDGLIEGEIGLPIATVVLKITKVVLAFPKAVH